MKQLTVKEAAQTRRSIRDFTDEPMSQEIIDEILLTAGLAPSPNNIQPWRVVVIQDKARLAKLQEISYNQRQVGGATTLFVVYSDMKNVVENIDDTIHPGIPAERRADIKANLTNNFTSMSEKDRENFGRQISYIFVGFLLLTLQSYGYSSSPMLGFDQEAYKKELGLPEHVEIPVVIASGVGAEPGFEHFRHPIERFTTKIG